MIGGGSMARWGWCTVLLVLVILLGSDAADPLVAFAQASYEISPLGTDAGRRVDRYQVTLGPGASLWELGFNRLPMIAIEQGGNWKEVLTTMWGSDDLAVFNMIISFWFVGRVYERSR